MPIVFEKKRVTVPQGSGAKSLSGSVHFDSRVRSSEIVLAGFRFNYLNKDHHIDEIEIEFLRLGQNPPNPNAVLFLVECKYQDKNGDDSWDGYVDVVVIAEID